MQNSPAASLSFSNLAWQNALSPDQERQALALAQMEALPEILAKVLVKAGVQSTTVQDYLNPTLRNLMPDPSTLQDMDKAVVRLVRAIQSKEKIAVFGDYDVDGACASALLVQYLRHFGLNPTLLIPDRIIDGYGPNIARFEALKAQHHTLIITVDCGSLSFEPINYAQENGMDVLVFDHHQMEASAPNAYAIVNPNRPDDLSNLGTICAAGVVFMVLVALNRALRQNADFAATTFPDLLKSLDMLALATVCDVMPLVGLNRAFVVQGLKAIAQRQRIGLNALCDVANLSGPVGVYALGFILGPRINAGGRIGDSELGAKLLLETDPIKAAKIAQNLNLLNLERQKIEEEATFEAYLQAQEKLTPDTKSILVSSNQWHVGILGLIASRLKSKFDMPAIAISFQASEQGAGSARSVEGVDMGAIMHEATHLGLLVKGGGHAMAAGLTIEKENIKAFEDFFAQQVHQQTQHHNVAKTLDIAATLNASALTLDLAETLEQAGPHGAGNPKPIFVLKNHTLKHIQNLGKGHLKLSVQSDDKTSIEVMFFRGEGTDLANALQKHLNERLDFALTVMLDTYLNQTRVKCNLVDASLPQRDLI